MADSCMLGERGREEEEQFSHLFSLIDQSLVQLAALVPPTSNSLCSRLFFFNYFCYSSSAAPSLCSISFISPPSFFFSPPTPPARCCFFLVSSSPPSWQRTVREAGTPTCTRRLSGDAAVFSSSNYETNGTLHRITSWRNGAGWDWVSELIYRSGRRRRGHQHDSIPVYTCRHVPPLENTSRKLLYLRLDVWGTFANLGLERQAEERPLKVVSFSEDDKFHLSSAKTPKEARWCNHSQPPPKMRRRIRRTRGNSLVLVRRLLDRSPGSDSARKVKAQ